MRGRVTTCLVVALSATSLVFPMGAGAHGDLASQYLIGHSVFFIPTRTGDSGRIARLVATVRDAGAAGFRTKVALIARPADLGAVRDYYNRPQGYAEFLGLDLALAYRAHLLVVMPNGYGYVVGGQPDPRARRLLDDLPDPGPYAAKQAELASLAVRRLAAASGHRFTAPAERRNGAQARDRITIAAAATAGVALIAAFVLYRRRRRTL